MSKRQLLSLFGVWVMIFLFLGFPASWERPLAVFTGLLIIFISYSHTRSHGSAASSSASSKPQTTSSFVESAVNPENKK